MEKELCPYCCNFLTDESGKCDCSNFDELSTENKTKRVTVNLKNRHLTMIDALKTDDESLSLILKKALVFYHKCKVLKKQKKEK